MNVVAVLAAACVIATFCWILIDVFRSRKKDAAIRIRDEANIVALSLHLQSIGDVETRIRRSLEEIQKLRPGTSSVSDLVHLEEAADPGQDETRYMKAIREKTEEVERIAKRRANP